MIEPVEIQSQVCECGCGESIPALTRAGKPRRFIHGHSGAGNRKPIDPRTPEEFMACVDVDPATGCWLWKYGRVAKGYGVVGGRCNPEYAHHRSFEIFKRKLQPGEWGLHSCDNPPCSNPEHLFPGDRAKNIADCVAKGRTARGERLPQTKLTAEKVLSLRQRYANGDSPTALSKELGISLRHTWNIIYRQAWRHV